MKSEQLAKWLHDNYEELAKAENWQTQEITRVEFENLPAENKNTMLALADRMLNTFSFISSNTTNIGSLPVIYVEQGNQTIGKDSEGREYYIKHVSKKTCDHPKACVRETVHYSHCLMCGKSFS